MPLRLPPHIISHIVTGAVLCCAVVGVCTFIKMSSDDNNNNKNNMSCCANCGKTEEDGNTTLKACVACKMVKYCNRECQINHRPKHKEECKKRAAELHDEALFKQPPHNEDCPICFIPLPKLHTTGSKYYACCGKVVCSGCIFSQVFL